MPGPYDYTVNIPQPPAQNFLQSLSGIMQIRNMQDQAEIARQQSEFAKQMQPLEMARVKAATDAQRAAIAQSATSRDVALEGLRQSKITFDREEAKAKEGDKLIADINELAKDPTSATRDKLLSLSYRAAAFNPKAYEPLKNMLKEHPRTGKMLENTASDVVFSIQGGQPDVALSSVEKNIKAAENTLQANPEDKEAKAALEFLAPVKKLLDEKKDGSAMVFGANFLRNVYPEQFDQVTKDMKEVAGIAETSAKTKKEQIATEGQLLDNRIKQYEADNGISLKDLAKNKEEKLKLETAERVHVEAQPFVRKYIDSRTAFEMMKTADPTASGDEALLTQFVKMGDPGSVVSVTEKGGVKNVTLSDYIGSLQAKLTSEGSLGEAKRKELKDQAYKMLKASEKQYKEYTGNLTARYKKQGLDPENIFVLPSSEVLREDTKKQAAGSTGAPGASINTGTLPVAPSTPIYTPPVGVTIKSVR